MNKSSPANKSKSRTPAGAATHTSTRRVPPSVRSAISPVSRRWFDFRLRRWAADEAVAPQGTQSTTHKKRIFFHAQIEVAHAGGAQPRTHQLAPSCWVGAARFRRSVDAGSIFDTAAGLLMRPSRRRAPRAPRTKNEYSFTHKSKSRTPAGAATRKSTHRVLVGMRSAISTVSRRWFDFRPPPGLLRASSRMSRGAQRGNGVLV